MVLQTNFARYNLQTTVMLEVDDRLGTGFIVMMSSHSPENSPIALVTNKHVLGRKAGDRCLGRELVIHANIIQGGGYEPQRVRVVYTADGYREHPHPYVDVCAFQPHFLEREVNFNHRFVNYDSLADLDIVSRYGVSPGDEILTVGYPLGFLQGVTNSPIVRQGIVATSLLQDLSGPALIGRAGALPAFLIDGGVLPGSSGSPVFLKPTIGRVLDGEIQLNPPPPIVLGIVAETRYAPLPGTSNEAFAGLGMAFRADTIRETLNLFSSG